MEGIDMGKTIHFRPDQEHGALRLFQALTALTDEELLDLKEMFYQRLCDRLEEHGKEVWETPANLAEMAMADTVIHEINHRLNTLRHAEADLNGGHRVIIDHDKDRWQASCWPYDEMCWESPWLGTVDEALAAGRRHHPGHEPEMPWPI